MEIKFSARFRKQYQRVDQKIKNAFRKRLKLFKENSYHPFLNNHALTGNYKGYRSINITGDWRALYSVPIIRSQNAIIFEIFGKHSQLYK